jgi:predicted nucleic acid-binding Zn ribbon protein
VQSLTLWERAKLVKRTIARARALAKSESAVVAQALLDRPPGTLASLAPHPARAAGADGAVRHLLQTRNQRGLEKEYAEGGESFSTPAVRRWRRCPNGG